MMRSLTLATAAFSGVLFLSASLAKADAPSPAARPCFDLGAAMRTVHEVPITGAIRILTTDIKVLDGKPVSDEYLKVTIDEYVENDEELPLSVAAPFLAKTKEYPKQDGCERFWLKPDEKPLKIIASGKDWLRMTGERDSDDENKEVLFLTEYRLVGEDAVQVTSYQTYKAELFGKTETHKLQLQGLIRWGAELPESEKVASRFAALLRRIYPEHAHFNAQNESSIEDLVKLRKAADLEQRRVVDGFSRPGFEKLAGDWNCYWYDALSSRYSLSLEGARPVRHEMGAELYNDQKQPAGQCRYAYIGTAAHLESRAEEPAGHYRIPYEIVTIEIAPASKSLPGCQKYVDDLLADFKAKHYSYAVDVEFDGKELVKANGSTCRRP